MASMSVQEAKRRPGDLILDRYMPNAAPEERERAHERLRRLALLVARVRERIEQGEATRENSEVRIQ